MRERGTGLGATNCNVGERAQVLVGATSPASRREAADLIGKYLQLRAKSWQSLAIGLRESNQAAMERYREQSAAADSLAKQISKNAD